MEIQPKFSRLFIFKKLINDAKYGFIYRVKNPSLRESIELSNYILNILVDAQS